MSIVIEKIGKFRKWFPSARHLWLFIRITAWSAIVPALFRALPLPRLMQILTPARPLREVTPEQLARAELINSYAVLLLKQNPRNIGRMCLKRSLVLYRFLRLEGIPARFCVGVRKDGEALAGHSWIEINGQRYFDSQANVPYSVTFACPVKSAGEQP